MADEQYRWLDRDTAERLLRGEPLDGVGNDFRDQADRLAEALGALGAQSTGRTAAGAELPGEEAALAAFRVARTGPGGEPAARAARPVPRSAAVSAAVSSDAGLVRLGRSPGHRRPPSRPRRPVRYGLAAALAAGMLGGGAMAAVSGELPFGGGDPEPTVSVTAAVTPERPLVSPSPDETPDGGAGTPRSEGGASTPDDGSRDRRDEAGDRQDEDTPDGSDGDNREDRFGRLWAGARSACRDYREGKLLDFDRRRSLEDAARGAERVRKYCRVLLEGRDGRDGRDGHDSTDDWDGRGSDGDGSDGDGGHVRPRLFRGDAGPTVSAPARPPATRAPDPAPDAGALPADPLSPAYS
ncbi:hypothetical protein AB0F07_07275 [Streptomyces fructofermentans]|uniref:hypothetical protein n=1 Tax=Streptomyces fructofermentans TaxID=152141 RepID=UPI00340FE518